MVPIDENKFVQDTARSGGIRLAFFDISYDQYLRRFV